MPSLDPVQRGAANLLRARILLMLSSGSVAAAVLSAGGCSGDVESSKSTGPGTGGSGSDTTGGTAGRGGGGNGGSTPGDAGRGGSPAGGTGAAGGVGGRGGASGAAGVGAAGVGGVAGAAGVAGTGGTFGPGGAAGALGSGGTTNCSQPNLCLTCEQLLQRFSYYLDGFSCGTDATTPPCPNLMGAGTMACENVCTAPVAQGGLCCYGLSPALPACGRPFSVGDEIRRAPVISRADWKRAAAGQERSGLGPELMRALAAEWEQDAVLEHASIASFARLTLELLALGAPPALVWESQAASLDEIEHAELCFALASRYHRAPIGPGTLAVDGALGQPDLATLAAETVREGCVGETLASLLATAQLERATDPEVRTALERIAEDEARHAELSWKIVRWALTAGGKPVSDAVSSAFERAIAASKIETASLDQARASSEGEAWHAHGRLFSDERRAVVRAALAEVIEPCARALLA